MNVPGATFILTIFLFVKLSSLFCPAMSTFTLPTETFDFLHILAENNQRDWFNAHKDRYLAAHADVIVFADHLLEEMRKHDHLETPSGKKSLHRIYRDTRFRKDKTPYKTHWSGSFRRATAHLRGGYYWHLEAGGKSMVGGGFWGPNKEDLLRIRQELAADASELREIIAVPEFVAHFGELAGEQLKTAPKGFDREHENIDLLRYKQFVVRRYFSDEEVLAPGFYQKMNASFMTMRPFFNFMSEVLTTDANGVPLV